jgi:hypothetical protein
MYTRSRDKSQATEIFRYIPYFNVTSGGKRCSMGTPIIKKSPTPPFLLEEEQRKKEKKTKVLTLNKYMAMGPSGARCQE